MYKYIKDPITSKSFELDSNDGKNTLAKYINNICTKKRNSMKGGAEAKEEHTAEYKEMIENADYCIQLIIHYKNQISEGGVSDSDPSKILILENDIKDLIKGAWQTVQDIEEGTTRAYNYITGSDEYKELAEWKHDRDMTKSMIDRLNSSNKQSYIIPKMDTILSKSYKKKKLLQSRGSEDLEGESNEVISEDTEEINNKIFWGIKNEDEELVYSKIVTAMDNHVSSLCPIGEKIALDKCPTIKNFDKFNDLCDVRQVKHLRSYDTTCSAKYNYILEKFKQDINSLTGLYVSVESEDILNRMEGEGTFERELVADYDGDSYDVDHIRKTFRNPLEKAIIDTDEIQEGFISKAYISSGQKLVDIKLFNGFTKYGVDIGAIESIEHVDNMDKIIFVDNLSEDTKEEDIRNYMSITVNFQEHIQNVDIKSYNTGIDGFHSRFAIIKFSELSPDNMQRLTSKPHVINEKKVKIMSATCKVISEIKNLGNNNKLLKGSTIESIIDGYSKTPQYSCKISLKKWARIAINKARFISNLKKFTDSRNVSLMKQLIIANKKVKEQLENVELSTLKYIPPNGGRLTSFDESKKTEIFQKMDEIEIKWHEEMATSITSRKEEIINKLKFNVSQTDHDKIKSLIDDAVKGKINQLKPKLMKLNNKLLSFLCFILDKSNFYLLSKDLRDAVIRSLHSDEQNTDTYNVKYYPTYAYNETPLNITRTLRQSALEVAETTGQVIQSVPAAASNLAVGALHMPKRSVKGAWNLTKFTAGKGMELFKYMLRSAHDSISSAYDPLLLDLAIFGKDFDIKELEKDVESYIQIIPEKLYKNNLEDNEENNKENNKEIIRKTKANIRKYHEIFNLSTSNLSTSDERINKLENTAKYIFWSFKKIKEYMPDALESDKEMHELLNKISDPDNVDADGKEEKGEDVAAGSVAGSDIAGAGAAKADDEPEDPYRERLVELMLGRPYIVNTLHKLLLPVPAIQGGGSEAKDPEHKGDNEIPKDAITNKHIQKLKTDIVGVLKTLQIDKEKSTEASEAIVNYIKNSYPNIENYHKKSAWKKMENNMLNVTRKLKGMTGWGIEDPKFIENMYQKLLDHIHKFIAKLSFMNEGDTIGLKCQKPNDIYKLLKCGKAIFQTGFEHVINTLFWVFRQPIMMSTILIILISFKDRICTDWQIQAGKYRLVNYLTVDHKKAMGTNVKIASQKFWSRLRQGLHKVTGWEWIEQEDSWQKDVTKLSIWNNALIRTFNITPVITAGGTAEFVFKSGTSYKGLFESAKFVVTSITASNNVGPTVVAAKNLAAAAGAAGTVAGGTAVGTAAGTVAGGTAAVSTAAGTVAGGTAAGIGWPVILGVAIVGTVSSVVLYYLTQKVEDHAYPTIFKMSDPEDNPDENLLQKAKALRKDRRDKGIHYYKEIKRILDDLGIEVVIDSEKYFEKTGDQWQWTDTIESDMSGKDPQILHENYLKNKHDVIMHFEQAVNSISEIITNVLDTKDYKDEHGNWVHNRENVKLYQSLCKNIMLYKQIMHKSYDEAMGYYYLIKLWNEGDNIIDETSIWDRIWGNEKNKTRADIMSGPEDRDKLSPENILKYYFVGEIADKLESEWKQETNLSTVLAVFKEYVTGNFTGNTWGSIIDDSTGILTTTMYYFESWPGLGLVAKIISTVLMTSLKDGFNQCNKFIFIKNNIQNFYKLITSGCYNTKTLEANSDSANITNKVIIAKIIYLLRYTNCGLDTIFSNKQYYPNLYEAIRKVDSYNTVFDTLSSALNASSYLEKADKAKETLKSMSDFSAYLGTSANNFKMFTYLLKSKKKMTYKEVCGEIGITRNQMICSKEISYKDHEKNLYEFEFEIPEKTADYSNKKYTLSNNIYKNINTINKQGKLTKLYAELNVTVSPLICKIKPIDYQFSNNVFNLTNIESPETPTLPQHMPHMSSLFNTDEGKAEAKSESKQGKDIRPEHTVYQTLDESEAAVPVVENPKVHEQDNKEDDYRAHVYLLHDLSKFIHDTTIYGGNLQIIHKELANIFIRQFDNTRGLRDKLCNSMNIPCEPCTQKKQENFFTTGYNALASVFSGKQNIKPIIKSADPNHQYIGDLPDEILNVVAINALSFKNLATVLNKEELLRASFADRIQNITLLPSKVTVDPGKELRRVRQKTINDLHLSPLQINTLDEFLNGVYIGNILHLQEKLIQKQQQTEKDLNEALKTRMGKIELERGEVIEMDQDRKRKLEAERISKAWEEEDEKFYKEWREKQINEVKEIARRRHEEWRQGIMNGTITGENWNLNMTRAIIHGKTIDEFLENPNYLSNHSLYVADGSAILQRVHQSRGPESNGLGFNALRKIWDDKLGKQPMSPAYNLSDNAANIIKAQKSDGHEFWKIGNIAELLKQGVGSNLMEWHDFIQRLDRVASGGWQSDENEFDANLDFCPREPQYDTDWEDYDDEEYSEIRKTQYRMATDIAKIESQITTQEIVHSPKGTELFADESFF